MKQYKNIIFDLGAVLVNWQPKEILSSIFQNETDETAWQKINEDNSQTWADFNRGLITTQDISKLFGKEYAEILFKELPKYLFILEDGIEILNKVKEKGYKTYILSNFPKEVFESANIVNNYEQYFINKFDGAIISYNIGKIKPEPEIYQALLDKYNLNPKECLFIDDKKINIDGAKHLGIDGIVCNNHDQLNSDLIKKGII